MTEETAGTPDALRDALGRLREGPDIGPKVAARIADIVEREVATLTTQLDAAKESEQNYKNLWHVTTRDLVIDTAKLEAELDAAKRALQLAHEHMQLYLVHYIPSHNVYEAMIKEIK